MNDDQKIIGLAPDAPDAAKIGRATTAERILQDSLYTADDDTKHVQRHPDWPCRSDGRCQYSIDSGAEGMGHCPSGKCVMIS